AYSIEAIVSPESSQLQGRLTATYFNRSPHALDRVYVHLRQNLNAPGAIRNRPQQITGGVSIASVRAADTPLVGRARGVGYSIDGTVMEMRLADQIPAGGEMSFSFAWSFDIPEQGAPRMGQDGEVYYLGYWYPQFAVFDDVHGWVAEQYMGDGEFYMGFADYEVSITVPEGYLVGATGMLENPGEVLSKRALDRYRSVASTDDVVSIVQDHERTAGTSTARSPTGTLTWRFTAEQVRDFAFVTSNRYVWDATRAAVGDRKGDGAEDHATIHTMYRPEEQPWHRSAEFGRFSVGNLSEMLVPYPYPQMTVVEGIIGGGMEYPMITLIGGSRTEQSLFGTTFHEISHMWIPLTAAHNEKHYAWMDEGLTTYNTREGTAAFWDTDAWHPDLQSYYSIAGSGHEVEPMRHADRYPVGTSARTIASYNKPAVALYALESILGKETFSDAYRTYMDRWAFKHPYPYDLFNTVEDVAGMDLDWFWTSLFYETWTLDQSIADVSATYEGGVVTVRDEGLTPMPAPVTLNYDDGSTEKQTVPVYEWLEGKHYVKLNFRRG
ncbi:MAG: M1 family metallopeptidase, partial [Rhodothermales bacterium]